MKIEEVLDYIGSGRVRRGISWHNLLFGYYGGGYCVYIRDTKTFEVFAIDLDYLRWRPLHEFYMRKEDTVKSLTGDYEFFDTDRVYSIMVITPYDEHMNSTDAVVTLCNSVKDHYQKRFRQYFYTYDDRDAYSYFSIHTDNYSRTSYRACSYEYYMDSVSKYRSEFRFPELVDRSLISENSVIFISTFNSKWTSRNVDRPDIEDMENTIRSVLPEDLFKIDYIPFEKECGLYSEA